MADYPVCPIVYTWLPSTLHGLCARLTILYLIVLLPLRSFCQEISIKKIELEGTDVFLYYSLNDSTPGRTCVVNLYSSKDNFVYPLNKVTGDVGIEIQPGVNKKIIWHAGEEFGNDFEGKITFEIRSKVYIPFLLLKDFNHKKLKRATNYEITWSGGRPQTVLNFDLYKDGKRVVTFTNIANVGHCSLTIPTHIKPGDGYQFKISDLKNKDEIIHTQNFRIVRKVPLLLKVAPVVMLGAGAYLVWGNPTDPHKDDIPDFPSPQ